MPPICFECNLLSATSRALGFSGKERVLTRTPDKLSIGGGGDKNVTPAEKTCCGCGLSVGTRSTSSCCWRFSSVCRFGASLAAYLGSRSCACGSFCGQRRELAGKARFPHSRSLCGGARLLSETSCCVLFCVAKQNLLYPPQTKGRIDCYGCASARAFMPRPMLTPPLRRSGLSPRRYTHSAARSHGLCSAVCTASDLKVAASPPLPTDLQGEGGSSLDKPRRRP